MNSLESVKQVKYLELPIKHFVIGLKMAKLKLLKVLPEDIYLINKTCLLFLTLFLYHHKQKKILSMHVFQVKNKKTILKDKLKSLDLNSQIIFLLKILGQELILKEKELKPFWNMQCSEESMKLWLPTKIDYQDSLLTYSKPSLNFMVEKSQSLEIQNTKVQNKNYQKICYPSFTSLAAVKWEEENINLKNLKIQIFPNYRQKKILNNWFGTNRFIYNKGLDYINNNPEDKDKFDFKHLRHKFITRKHRSGLLNNNLLGLEWLFETPKEVRTQSLKSLCSNFKSAFSNLKNNNISKFKMKFKSKKSITDSMVIPKSAISFENNKFKIYPRYSKTEYLLGKRKNKKLNNLKIEHDCKLIKQYNKYYLLVPVKINKKNNKQSNQIISLDAGNRTFLTGYSPNGHTLEINRNKKLLIKYFERLDLLRSLRTKKKIRKTKLYKQELKIKNFVNDLHWKSCNYLVNNYSNIFLGQLESQKCSMKMFNSKCNRNLLTLSHYLFRQRLIYKCNENNVKICITSEEYTSKTCTNCGKLNNKLGSSKVFNCSSCELKIDRDVNGARNILIKSICC